MPLDDPHEHGIDYVVFSVGFAGAQETKIEVPFDPTAADSGDEMYKEYCADCHFTYP